MGQNRKTRQVVSELRTQLAAYKTKDAIIWAACDEGLLFDEGGFALAFYEGVHDVVFAHGLRLDDFVGDHILRAVAGYIADHIVEDFDRCDGVRVADAKERHEAWARLVADLNSIVDAFRAAQPGSQSTEMMQ